MAKQCFTSELGPYIDGAVERCLHTHIETAYNEMAWDYAQRQQQSNQEVN